MRLWIEELEPGVTRLRMRSWRGALVGYDVSAYLLGDVLVDTGFSRGGRQLLRAIDSLRPRGVVLTHWHEDHAGNAPALAARGVPMTMHVGSEALLRERPVIRLYRRQVWGYTAPLRSSGSTSRRSSWWRRRATARITSPCGMRSDGFSSRGICFSA